MQRALSITYLGVLASVLGLSYARGQPAPVATASAASGKQEPPLVPDGAGSGSGAKVPATVPGRDAGAGDPYDNVHVSLLGDATIWTAQIGSRTDTNFGGGLQAASAAFFVSVLVKNGRVGKVSGEERNYGRFLLTPAAAELAVTLQAAWFVSETWKGQPGKNTGLGHLRGRGLRLGFAAVVQAGGADWEERVSSDGGATVARTMNVVGFGAQLGPVLTYGPGEDCARYINCWELQVAFGYANRMLMGDGRQDKSFRQNVLGYDVATNEDPRPSWHGGFVSVRGGVKNVKIGMDLVLLRGGDKSLTGLTTGQLVPLINIGVPIDLGLAKREGTDDGKGPEPTGPSTMNLGL